MNIQWLGHSCFKISEKIDAQEAVLVTSPFGKESGLFPPKLKADAVIINKTSSAYDYTEKISGNLTEQVLIIDRPGEYEAKKIFVTGLAVGDYKDPGVIYKINFGNISVAHLGGLNHLLNEAAIEFLGDCDVLLIPVGGGSVLTGAQAAEIVRLIEPRLVIPMEYKISGLNYDLAPVDKFIAAMGVKAETTSKLKIAPRDLPEDATKVIILEKS